MTDEEPPPSALAPYVSALTAAALSFYAITGAVAADRVAPPPTTPRVIEMTLIP